MTRLSSYPRHETSTTDNNGAIGGSTTSIVSLSLEDYNSTYQKYSSILSAINSLILLTIGNCLLFVPTFIIDVLLDYKNDNNDNDGGVEQPPSAMLLSVTRMGGGVLISQGISSFILTSSVLYDWIFVAVVVDGGRKIIHQSAVTTHRIAIFVQFVTGLLWVMVGLLDDRTTPNHPDGHSPNNNSHRKAFGLLVIGFFVLILSLLALMLSYWPVYDDDENENEDEEIEETTRRRNDDERCFNNNNNENLDLMEPLLRSSNNYDETGRIFNNNIENNDAEVIFRPLEDHDDNDHNRNRLEEGVVRRNNDNNNSPDDMESNDDDDDDNNSNDIGTSRIRGTRRLLKLARPQVSYLYIGCLTLLIRLPFSLCIPHFVSTTLGALARQDYAQARSEILWLFILGTIDALLDFWCIFWFGYANLRISRGVRIDLFASILKQEMGFFDQHTSGELTSRLTSDCGEMAGDLTWFFRFSIESVVRITGITAYMLIRCPRLGACALSIVPLVAIINKYYGNWMNRNAQKVQDATAAANSVAQEALSCIRTVISFASEEVEYDKYTAKIDDQYRLNVKQTFMTGVYFMFVSTFLINTVVQGSLLLIGSYMIQRGHLNAEILLAFMLYQGQLQNEMMNLFQSYSSLVKSSGAGDKVFALLDRRPPPPATGSEETSANSQLALVSEQRQQSSISLKLQNVKFTYPSRPNHPVLQGVDLSVKEGQTLALVGPSGCGKSTICSLLQRFYDPIPGGRILAGNDDIKDIGIKAHRQRLGVVTQDPTLFTGTILSNITYGVTSATRAQAIDAAKQANAHDFICSFPNGYETEVGERGFQLSGGQKQRIAIARAIVRKPSLLLLDEATSALDAESEEIVQAALDNLLNNNQGITTVIIAHRLRTVRNADIIAVVNKGQIVEKGSHDSLMNIDDGYYKGMVEKSLGGRLPDA